MKAGVRAEGVQPQPALRHGSVPVVPVWCGARHAERTPRARPLITAALYSPHGCRRYLPCSRCARFGDTAGFSRCRTGSFDHEEAPAIGRHIVAS